MKNIRPFVKMAPEPMTAEFPHDTATFRFGELLDRCTDMTGRMTRFHGGDTPLHRLVRHIDKALRLSRNGPDGEHPTRIPMPTVHDQRHIDIDDVALAQCLGAWNSVTHNMVNRRADGLCVPAIIQRRRNGIVLSVQNP